MRLNAGNSLMRLTASCEIKVRNVGRADGCVVLEIRQVKLEEWARGNGLTYEESDLPGTTGSGKKIVTFSRRR